MQACMSDVSGGRDCEAQGGRRGMRGVGLCEEGACTTREVVGSPGAERAPVRTPSEELGDASQTSSQTGDETILRDGQQEVGRRGYGFRRLRSEVGGVLRTTREAADAAVRQAKRLFFRDAG